MARPTITVDYTSRDYAAIKSDLIALVTQQLKDLYPNLQWDPDDPSDFGVVLLEMFAYMGDIMSYYIDRAANETAIDTAVQRSTLLNMAALYGYRPSGPTQAVTEITFTNNGSSSVALPVGTQVLATYPYGSTTKIYFETTDEITELEAGQSFTVAAIEGKTSNTESPDPVTHLPTPVLLVDSYGNSQSTGAANQRRIINDTNIVDGSLVVYVGQGDLISKWTFVDNLVDAAPNDQVFTTALNPNGTTTVIFGDGVNGSIPEDNKTLSVMYKTSVGYAGNISTYNTPATADPSWSLTFIPGSVLPLGSISVVNNIPASGGADPDSTSQIKSKIKRAISSRRRAVTLEDYEALAELVSGVGRAKAVGSNPSSVVVYMQSQPDGSTTPGWDTTIVATDKSTSTWKKIKQDVLDYLADKIPVGSSVTVTYPEYRPFEVSVSVEAYSNYKNSLVQTSVINALSDSYFGLFSFENYGFEATVLGFDIYKAVLDVPGVRSLTISVLDFKDGGAGYADRYLAANEIPVLYPEDVTVVVTGGID